MTDPIKVTGLARDPETALRKAAALMRHSRWIKGKWSQKPYAVSHKQQYGYCVVGALRHVVSGKETALGRPLPKDQEAIVIAAAEQMFPGTGYPIQAAQGWNDSMARSADEVITKLEGAAKHGKSE